MRHSCMYKLDTLSWTSFVLHGLRNHVHCTTWRPPRTHSAFATVDRHEFQKVMVHMDLYSKAPPIWTDSNLDHNAHAILCLTNWGFATFYIVMCLNIQLSLWMVELSAVPRPSSDYSCQHFNTTDQCRHEFQDPPNSPFPTDGGVVRYRRYWNSSRPLDLLFNWRISLGRADNLNVCQVSVMWSKLPPSAWGLPLHQPALPTPTIYGPSK